MSLTVLNVAYPLAPVSPDAVGGAEQVLAALDRALVAAGHRSIVIACEGSCVAGQLFAVPAAAGELDDAAKTRAQACHRAAIAAALRRFPIDVVHLHGIDFSAYVPEGVPALVSLHLPLDWYPAAMLRPARDDLWLIPVSAAQAAAAPPGARLRAPIPNGIDLTLFAASHARRRFALLLSRIAPEKGVHLALDAAREAEMPLLIGGQVYSYRWHLDYFEHEVAPRLDAERRFLGRLGLARKRRFLGAARCLVIPSLAAETSSLVAMEALAAGTPVVAFPNGALPTVIEDGRTGFIVHDVAEMAEAMRRVGELDREACRQAAQERFSADRMIAGYFDAYRRLARTRAMPHRVAC
jgi:glycosyltransferase involved in cell wall biosynthesis